VVNVASPSNFMRAALLTIPISTPEPTPCPDTSAIYAIQRPSTWTKSTRSPPTSPLGTDAPLEGEAAHARVDARHEELVDCVREFDFRVGPKIARAFSFEERNEARIPG
jgi:hypothetical protein